MVVVVVVGFFFLNNYYYYFETIYTCSGNNGGLWWRWWVVGCGLLLVFGGTRFLVVIRLLERDRKENREINKQIKSSVNGCPYNILLINHLKKVFIIFMGNIILFLVTNFVF